MMAIQKVTHGGMIDAVTTDEMNAMLQGYLQTDQAQSDVHRKREKRVFQLDGTGGNSGSPGTIAIPRNYDWELQRITAASTPTGGGGRVDIYENQVNISDLLEHVVLDASGFYSDSFSNNCFVSAGSTLFIVFAAASNNGIGAVNLQIRMTKVR